MSFYPHSTKKSVLIAFLLLIFFVTAKAQYTKTHADISAVPAGAYFTANVMVTPVSQTAWQQVGIHKRALRVTLDMGDVYELGTLKIWSASLTAELEAFDLSNNKLYSYPISLSIQNKKPAHIALVDYTSLGNVVHHFKVKINGYTINPSLAFVSSRIRFRVEQENEVAYGTTEAIAPFAAIRPYPVSVVPMTNNNGEVAQVTFNWTLPQAAQKFKSYDLDIVKIEPDMFQQVKVDWSTAATIEVDDATAYTMTLAEGTGYYFWRVRGIGDYFPGGRSDARNYGAWSNQTDDNQQQNLTSQGLYSFSGSQPVSNKIYRLNEPSANPPQQSIYTIIYNPSSSPFTFFYYQQFDEQLNWSYGKVLTEGSRQSESMTFANGLGKVQQVQTKLFSEGQTGQVVGAQSVYDYSGRAAVSSLPAPVDDDKFGYKEHFMDNTNNKTLQAADFDADGNIYLSSSPLASNITGTINKYYSAYNTQDDRGKLVPDAKGFPFSRILYYSDATGRPFISSGPGETMRLKTGTDAHNTEVMYSAVSQTELDRVFGNEAPLAATVYKTTTLDPNGVPSVVYISKTGQTLMTCISNVGALKNLDPITPANAQPFTVVDKFDPGVVTPGEIYSRTSKTLSILPDGSTAIKTSKNEDTKDVKFEYSLSPANYGITCKNICSDCDYLVEIAITCPQQPYDNTRNGILRFKVSPAAMSAATCSTTPTPITLLNASGKILTGPPTSNTNATLQSAGSNFGDLLSAPVDPTVYLPKGTYLIEKKVYTYTQDANGQFYLTKAIQELQQEAKAWTAQNNCCGPFTIDASGFDCGSTLPDCSNEALLRHFHGYVLEEINASSTYNSALSIIPSSHNINGYNLSVFDNGSNGFKQYVINEILAKMPETGTDLGQNTSCQIIQECFEASYAELQRNFSLCKQTDPALYDQRNTTFDFIAAVRSCLQIDDPCQARKQIKIYNNETSTPTYTAEDVVVWYKSTSVTAEPTGIGTGHTLIQIFNPDLSYTGGLSPNNSESVVKSVTHNSNCYGMYKYPSPLTPTDLTSEIDKQAWSAKQLCKCVTNPNNLPVETNEDPGLGIVDQCKSLCDQKGVVMGSSIHQWVREYNMVTLQNDPLGDVWKDYNEIFTTPDRDSACIVQMMVDQCKSQCEMPHVVNSDLDCITTGIGCPAAFPSKALYLAEIEREKEEFKKAFLWQPLFAPLAPAVNLTPPLAGYSKVGDQATVQQEILDFMKESLQIALNNRTAHGNLPNSPDFYPISLQSSPLTDNSYLFTHYAKSFVLPTASNPAQYKKTTAVVNCIWDPVNGGLKELNAALYCTDNSEPVAYWVYDPTAAGGSSTDCDFFVDFAKNPFYSIQDVVSFSFDASGGWHAQLNPERCGAVSKSNGVCAEGYLAVLQLDLSAITSGTNLNAEISNDQDSWYLTDKSIDWNAAGASATVTDLVNAINQGTLAQGFKASNWNGSNYTTILKVYVPLSYKGKLNAIKLVVTTRKGSGPDLVIKKLTTVEPSVCAEPITTSLVNANCFNASGSEIASDAFCPYGYMRVSSNSGSNTYPITSLGTSMMFGDIFTFWKTKIKEGVMNRTISIPSTAAYTVVDDDHTTPYTFAQSNFSYYQGVYSFSFNNSNFDAVATVIRNTQGVIKAIQVAIFNTSDATKPVMYRGTIYSDLTYPTLSLLPNYDIPNSLPDPADLEDVLGFYYDNFRLSTYWSASEANTNYSATHTTVKNGSFRVVDVNYGDSNDALHVMLTSTQNSGNQCTACMAWQNPAPQLEIANDKFHPLSCEEMKQQYIEAQTRGKLEACFQDKLTKLQDDYRSNCLDNIVDEFKITYTLPYEQYTISRYDRAGNLISNVPSEGIDFLGVADGPQHNINRLQKVADHRANPVTNPAEYPNHRLVTRYHYNSIKQLIMQETPDGGVSKFWYNANAQLIASQSARQAAENDGVYSYSRYTALGQIAESGQIRHYTPTVDLTHNYHLYSDNSDHYQKYNDFWNGPNALYFPYTDQNLTAMVGSVTKEQVVRTFYTDNVVGVQYPPTSGSQQNLRNRVSKASRDENGDGVEDSYIAYSYDPSGTVEWMVEKLPSFEPRYMRYEYELISGRVNKLVYMENSTEQLIHEYKYDSDGKILKVATSTDGMSWTHEASYEYYQHGPLYSEKVGQDLIQAQQNVYTIEGYLKSINQAELDPNKDPGKDGTALPGNPGSYLPDEFGMELGYYDGDYDRAGSHIGKASTKDPYAGANPLLHAKVHSLYNGNIGYWMSNTRSGQTTATNPPEILGMDLKMHVYRYNKLNQLHSSDLIKYNSGWGLQSQLAAYYDVPNDAVAFADINGNEAFDERFYYDRVGNLLSLKRNGGGANLRMDEFTYRYKKDADGNLLDNRLYHVNDNVALNSNYLKDIDDQGTFDATSATINTNNNYSYDASGNLIKDKSENIEKIAWNAMNKVEYVQKKNTTTGMYYFIRYNYDPLGQRTMKMETEQTANINAVPSSLKVTKATWYVLDGSGNHMGIYRGELVNGNLAEVKLEEQPIYGSERIGEYRPGTVLASYSSNDVLTGNIPVTPKITTVAQQNTTTNLVFNEYNQWLVATKSAKAGNFYKDGTVGVQFNTAGQALANGSAMGFLFSLPIDGLKELAVAENEKGMQMARFQYVSNYNIPVLTDAQGQTVFGSWNINADKDNPGVFVQLTTGAAPQYLLVTGKNGQLYYHEVNVASNGQVTTGLINQPISGISYSTSMNKFSLTAYNNLQVNGGSKVYIMLNTNMGVSVYSWDAISRQVPPALVKTWSSGGSMINGTTRVTGDQLQISPSGNELALTLTETKTGGIISTPGSTGNVGAFFNINPGTNKFSFANVGLTGIGTTIGSIIQGTGKTPKVPGSNATCNTTSPAPNTTHRLEFFTLTANTGVATHQASGAIPLQTEYAKSSAYEHDITSFDYSPNAAYIYYIEKSPCNGSNCTVCMAGSTTGSLKRLNRATKAIESIDNYSGDLNKAEIRRAVNDHIYVNQLPLLSNWPCGNGICSVPVISQLKAYGDVENSNYTLINKSTLALNGGDNNFGMVVQPYRVYTSNFAVTDVVYSERETDERLYASVDHLGNTRVVVSDVRQWDDNGDDVLTIGENKTDVRSWNDYYAFGSPMPGRSYNSTDYKYGFGGQEKDDEISGSGNSYTAEYWQYDPRTGRRWNRDAIFKNWESPYACFNNNPIVYNDPFGLNGEDRARRKAERYASENGSEVKEHTKDGKKSFTVNTVTGTGYDDMTIATKTFKANLWDKFVGCLEDFDRGAEHVFDNTAAGELGNAIDERYDGAKNGGNVPTEVQAVLSFNPAYSIPNAVKSVTTGQNALGEDVSNGEKGLELASLLPGGVLLKAAKPLITTYKAARLVTKGYKGVIQAHHIVESRHLRALGLSVMDAPAIVLSKEQHQAITNVLQTLLPTGKRYEIGEILDAYKQAYKDFPEWYEAAAEFLTK